MIDDDNSVTKLAACSQLAQNVELVNARRRRYM